ncbi:MAG: hypothetical protein ACYC0Q_10525 [Eubacteriales bacterium]
MTAAFYFFEAFAKTDENRLFTSNGSGYVRPAGCFETLEAGPDSTYVLTFISQVKPIGRRY